MAVPTEGKTFTKFSSLLAKVFITFEFFFNALDFSSFFSEDHFLFSPKKNYIERDILCVRRVFVCFYLDVQQIMFWQINDISECNAIKYTRNGSRSFVALHVPPCAMTNNDFNEVGCCRPADLIHFSLVCGNNWFISHIVYWHVKEKETSSTLKLNERERNGWRKLCRLMASTQTHITMYIWTCWFI